MSELLPCPHCGSGPARSEGKYTQASFSGVELIDNGTGYFIWCGTCGYMGDLGSDADSAADVWNNRAKNSPQGEIEGI